MVRVVMVKHPRAQTPVFPAQRRDVAELIGVTLFCPIQFEYLGRNSASLNTSSEGET
jgi:hypothetical protein